MPFVAHALQARACDADRDKRLNLRINAVHLLSGWRRPGYRLSLRDDTAGCEHTTGKESENWPVHEVSSEAGEHYAPNSANVNSLLWKEIPSEGVLVIRLTGDMAIPGTSAIHSRVTLVLNRMCVSARY
jgi:hypothetical protein